MRLRHSAQLPTIPRAYRVDEMLADPIALNSRLGTYTNFVNLLDLCALSVPAAILPDGIPFGVTVIGRAGDEATLAAVGRLFHAETELPMGATGKMQPVLGREGEVKKGTRAEGRPPAGPPSTQFSQLASAPRRISPVACRPTACESGGQELVSLRARHLSFAWQVSGADKLRDMI